MNKNIGRMIRDARNRNGLSQAELAEKVGVSQAAIGQWERGTFTPRGRNLNALAEVLGIALQPEFELPELDEQGEEKGAPIPSVKLEDVTALRRRELAQDPQRQEEVFIAEETRARMIVSEHKAQAGEFERTLLELLSQVDAGVRVHVPLEGGPMFNQWTIDYLTQQAVIEVKHPSSYVRADEIIARTLWNLTVLRSFMGDRRSYVALIRRPPLAALPAHALPFYEKKLTKLAAEADLVGIHLLIVDTPEEAVKAITEIEDDRSYEDGPTS